MVLTMVYDLFQRCPSCVVLPRNENYSTFNHCQGHQLPKPRPSEMEALLLTLNKSNTPSSGANTLLIHFYINTVLIDCNIIYALNNKILCFSHVCV